MTKPNRSRRTTPKIVGFKMPEPKRDHLSPAERLAEHKASKAHTGPDPGSTLRMIERGRRGGEKGAEAPLVRSLYDLANPKPKRRRGRRDRAT